MTKTKLPLFLFVTRSRIEKPKNDDGWVTLEEGAAFMGCSVAHLKNLRSTGKLHVPYRKAGRKVILSKKALDEYLKANTKI